MLEKGQVIRLDRGFPLVRVDNSEPFRCEHAVALVKDHDKRAVIGDYVMVEPPHDHDKGIIESILPRFSSFVRKDPTERALPQVLAANFDRVFVAQPITELNVRRLERELVLAHETGMPVSVILTKTDLLENASQADEVRCTVEQLAGNDVEVLTISDKDPESIDAVRRLIPENTMAVLIGKSGVGKSSLVNMLVGYNLQATSSVREGDGKGRHTTVNREIVKLPNGGFVVDMPGVRGLGLWDADSGITTAFSDVEELANHCRFRDCRHENEPGCAVRAAVEEGTLSAQRFESYRALKQETVDLRARREQARHMRGEKASDKKKAARAMQRGRGRKRR